MTSSELGGPTGYPPLVFHLPRLYLLALTGRVKWQTVGGCVIGHANVRGYHVMLFPSSTKPPVILSQEAIQGVSQTPFALDKSKQGVPTHFLSMGKNYC